MFPYHQYSLAHRNASSTGDTPSRAADARPGRKWLNGRPRRAAAKRSLVGRLWDLLRGRRDTSGAVAGAPADRHCTRDSGAVPEHTAILRERGMVLIAGAYITDGDSLFRIEHMHSDRASGKTFIELEDCTTMVLSVCTEEALVELALRPVVPFANSDPGQSSGVEDVVVGADPGAAPR